LHNVFFQRLSLVSDEVIPPRLPPSASCRIFSMQSTVLVLVLLDRTAAFDTVDHEILRKRLRVTCGVDSAALAWFRSYLVGRRRHVRCGATVFTYHRCHLRRTSRIGPWTLFIIYTADLAPIVNKHGVRRISMPMTARFTAPVRLPPPLLCLSTFGSRSFPVAASVVWTLEFLACSPTVFIISLHVSTTAKDISLSAVILRHRHLTSLRLVSHSRFSPVANASRFSTKPSPTDSHWSSRRSLYKQLPAERHVSYWHSIKVTEERRESSMHWSTTPLGLVRNILLKAPHNTYGVNQTLLSFSDSFSQTNGNFQSKFYMPINVSMYGRLQIIIQLSPTLTHLCHVKCDHPACLSANGGHFEYTCMMLQCNVDRNVGLQ